MTDDEQSGFRFWNTRRDLARSPQQELRHVRMIPGRLAIFPDLIVRPLRQASLQLQLPWDYGLREIAFTDEIRHHVDFADLGIVEEKERIAEARFLFPETACDLAEDALFSNRFRLGKTGRTRIRVDRRAVANNQESGIRT